MKGSPVARGISGMVIMIFGYFQDSGVVLGLGIGAFLCALIEEVRRRRRELKGGAEIVKGVETNPEA